MAVRFAGDFFGIPLTTPDEDQSSRLIKYFPELRSPAIKPRGTSADSSDVGARLYGGIKAPPTFAGFKTFEVANEKKAAPLFAGFKTLEQPETRTQPAEQEDTKTPARNVESIDPDLLKALGLS